MGLCSSVTGAGVGFATYEALMVAYRQRMGYAPTPAERGAIAGVQQSCLTLQSNSMFLVCGMSGKKPSQRLAAEHVLCVHACRDRTHCRCAAMQPPCASAHRIGSGYCKGMLCCQHACMQSC